MERHLVHAGQRAQAPDIVGDQRVVVAEHGAERLHGGGPLPDHGLVRLIAEQVDAVGTGQVNQPVAVEIEQQRTLRPLEENAGRQRLAYGSAELERHPVASGELQVRKPLASLPGQRDGAGETLIPCRLQPLEAGPPRRCDRVGRVVDTEEAVAGVIVERDLARDALGEPDMTGQARMLGAGQAEPLAAFDDGGEAGARRGDGEKNGSHAPCETIAVTRR
jgi:hypothetical protein